MTEVAAASTREQARKKGSMREVMPQTAAFVDMARQVMGELLGAEAGTAYVDDIVRCSMKGDGGFYAAEVGPDGVLRELGSMRRGARYVLDERGDLVLAKGGA